jgi:hypothetical protein
MILLTPKNCKNIIGINPEEVSYFELKKGSTLFSGEENPKEAILVEIIMKDGKKLNFFYGFDDMLSRNKCFSELKNLKIEEIIKILNATQFLKKSKAGRPIDSDEILKSWEVLATRLEIKDFSKKVSMLIEGKNSEEMRKILAENLVKYSNCKTKKEFIRKLTNKKNLIDGIIELLPNLIIKYSGTTTLERHFSSPILKQFKILNATQKL